ncbi:MmgE/PrpD family protein [Amycolatopsis alkalitolerans]|uniref:MmgE/PrpD family protein n=1 Tax=Amycolatopsis alkalitolerans TaxID=2547244 RepID=A0A5C4LSZ0_9PSEU|nr:MmgE/PrpD family protein [Amycolatopsis alkalitolerans]TNC20214.1 MmgE/PrpD family protein [Amycolatopsis alkalitolerans]
MSLVSELAERGHAVATGRVPAAVLAAARAHLTDTVAAVVAGYTTLRAPAARLADARGLAPPARTAFTGGVYAGAWEVAGIHRGAVLCPGCVVLPAMLAALELRPSASGEEVLRAYLAGYEVALAAALSVGGDRLIELGWWPTALVAPLGGAAAASILLGKPVPAIASAIALAAQQAGGSVAGTTADADGRYLLSGLAAERAVTAVLTAGSGWRGPLDVLDDPRSPLRRRRNPPEPFLLPETSLKAHAGAKHMQAALDALSAMDDEVRGIRCALPGPLVRAVDRPPPFRSPLHALASAQYMLAVAALRGRCTPWEFDAASLTDPRITGLARRVEVVADEELSRAYPVSWGARLEIATHSGTVRLERHHARGDPGHELSTGELLRKAVTLAGPALGDEAARGLASALLDTTPAAVLTEQVLPLLRPQLARQEA